MRGATGCRRRSSSSRAVSIHAPHAGRDDYCKQDVTVTVVSIHAPHAGRDLRKYVILRAPWFQSTRPMRGATSKPSSQSRFSLFQSTRPMRGATRHNAWRLFLCKVSIHAPHAGRDHLSMHRKGVIRKFQSTRPMRGATERSPARRHGHARFNPRAPCGARLS